MATKFRANAGTQPNAAGLEQIPAGSNRIPQGFLNGIGRKIDRATVRFSGDFLFQALPGGTVMQPLDTGGTSGGLDISHPFKVSCVGKTSTKIQVRIAEGHIWGRTEFGVGAYSDIGIDLNTPNQSLGIPGVDYFFAGGWPNGNPVPDTSGGKNPTSQGTQSKEPTKDSGGVFNRRPSGNAGSIIEWTDGQFNRRPSGNAGSIVDPGSGGIYHTQQPSGAAGNINTYPQIYGRNQVNGVYVNPPKQ